MKVKNILQLGRLMINTAEYGNIKDDAYFCMLCRVGEKLTYVGTLFEPRTFADISEEYQTFTKRFIMQLPVEDRILYDAHAKI